MSRKRLDDLRQKIGSNSRNDADAQAAAERPVPSPRQILQLIDRLKDRAGALGKLLAKSGQPDLPAASFDQRCADQFFQFTDLERKGGLRNGAGLGSTPEMADLRQSVKIAEMFHGERNHKLSISQPLEYTIGNYGTRLLVIVLTERGCSCERPSVSLRLAVTRCER